MKDSQAINGVIAKLVADGVLQNHEGTLDITHNSISKIVAAKKIGIELELVELQDMIRHMNKHGGSLNSSQFHKIEPLQKQLEIRLTEEERTYLSTKMSDWKQKRMFRTLGFIFTFLLLVAACITLLFLLKAKASEAKAKTIVLNEYIQSFADTDPTLSYRLAEASFIKDSVNSGDVKDAILRLFNKANGILFYNEFVGDSSNIIDYDISGNDSSVAAVTESSSMIVWDKFGKVKARIKMDTLSLAQCNFINDSQIIINGTYETKNKLGADTRQTKSSVILLFDLDSNTSRRLVTTQATIIESLDVSLENGKVLYALSDGKIEEINLNKKNGFKTIIQDQSAEPAFHIKYISKDHFYGFFRNQVVYGYSRLNGIWKKRKFEINTNRRDFVERGLMSKKATFKAGEKYLCIPSTRSGKVLVLNTETFNLEGSLGVDHIGKNFLPISADFNNVNGEKLLVVGTKNNEILVKKGSSGDIEYLNEHEADVHTVRISPNGLYFVTLSDDRTAKLWSSKGVLLATVRGLNNYGSKVMFSRNSGYMLLNLGHSLRLWNLRQSYSERLYPSAQKTDTINSVMLDRDTIIFSSKNFGLFTWPFKKAGARPELLVGPRKLDSLIYAKDKFHEVSKDGRFMLLIRDKNVWFFKRNPDTHKWLKLNVVSRRSVKEIKSAHFYVDRITKRSRAIICLSKFINGSSGSQIFTVDMEDGTQIELMKCRTELFFANADVEGGSYYFASNFNKLHVRKLTSQYNNLNDNDDVMTLSSHKSSVNFAVDSKNYFATTSEDRTVRVWFKTGHQKFVLDEHIDGVIFCDISKDENYLVSSSDDNSIIVWDLRTGKSLLTLKETSRPVTMVKFSEDSKYLIFGSRDGTVKVKPIELNPQNIINLVNNEKVSGKIKLLSNTDKQ